MAVIIDRLSVKIITVEGYLVAKKTVAEGATTGPDHNRKVKYHPR